MKNRKLIFMICILLALCTLYGIRYSSLNSRFKEMYARNTSEEYKLNETVEFGEDKNTYGDTCPGYSVTVNDFEMYDRGSFETAFDIDFDAYAESMFAVPDKLAVVSVLFGNEGNNENGVMLESFVLHGVDSYLFPEFPLTNAVNPSLGDATGIKIASGNRCELKLVYCLNDFRFSDHVWKHIDDYKMWLNVTSYPTKKDILLQWP